MALDTGRSSSQHRILSVAAMLVAAGLAVPPAYAADLGGNCCADLEERVAELEATVARKGNRRVSLTISGQVQTSVMAWDAGGEFGSLPGKVEQFIEVTGVAGTVNGGATTAKVITQASAAGVRAGNSRDVYIVDTLGGTAFNLAGDAKINPNLTAGFYITLAINSQARSTQVNQRDDDAPDAIGSGDGTFVMNLANWFIDHKQVGRLTVGRVNTATSGISGIDLGGAGVIANVNVGWTQRAFFANNAASANNLVTWSDLLGGAAVNGSTTSRANAISYTSPTMGGFQVQAAWGENDVWDAALRYAGEFEGFRVAAGVGYISNSNGTNEVVADLPANSKIDAPSQWKGSASILHVASGLYLTAAHLVQDNAQITAGDEGDTRLTYLNGGIAKNWTGLGNTVLYGEYARVAGAIKTKTDIGVDGSPTITGTDVGNASMWGLGVVQHIDAAAMELYVSYRNFSSDASLNSGFKDNEDRAIFNKVEDFNVVVGGARIKF